MSSLNVQPKESPNAIVVLHVYKSQLLIIDEIVKTKKKGK